MAKLFHLFSKGSSSVDLFTSEQEFIDGVNRLAITSLVNGVRVLAFSLQDTHLHSILYGELNEVVAYKTEYQRRTRYYLSRFREDASYNDFALDLLEIEDPIYSKVVGSYVICQATKDGKPVLPYDYKWSSAALYFRTVNVDFLWTSTQYGERKPIHCISEMSDRKIFDQFHTRVKPPGEWKECDGLILPSSFVDVRAFESIYKTHNSFRVFCGSAASRDKEVLDRIANQAGVSLDEQEARFKAKELCRIMYGHQNIRSLSVGQRLEIARCLRKQYGMGLSQISRRVYMPEDEVRRYVR